MALSDIVQATELLRVNGKEYRTSPLGIRDFGEFERWVEMLPIENLKPHLPGLETTERMQLLKDARAECKVGSGSLVGEAGQAMMNTVRGAGYLFWLSLRRHQPELSRDQAEELVTMDSLMDIRSSLLKMSGVVDGENPPIAPAASAGAATTPSNGQNSSSTSPSDTAGQLTKSPT